MQQKEFETIIGKEEVVPTEIVAKSRKNVNHYFVIMLGALALFVVVYYVLPPSGLKALEDMVTQDHHRFYWMVLVGFLAELVAGSMGMGYGVICTTILLLLNVPPPFISASIHSAEAFTSAAGTLSHFKLGNINMKLAKLLAIPAIIGAVVGALLLSRVGHQYEKTTKAIISLYTLYLGIRI